MNDAYLKRQYRITLEERDAIIREQNGKCLCGRVLDENCRLEVDHEHFKIQSFRRQKDEFTAQGVKWCAYVDWPWEDISLRPIFYGRTKVEAVKAAKKGNLRKSVRGVLCGGRYAGCNRKLGRIDNAPWLESVVNYLKDPPARRVLSKETP